jgi:hypothetical protein
MMRRKQEETLQHAVHIVLKRILVPFHKCTPFVKIHGAIQLYIIQILYYNYTIIIIMVHTCGTYINI